MTPTTTREHEATTVLESFTLTIELTRESDTPNQWTSTCVELDIISAGKTPERALDAVAEAVRMTVDYCVKRIMETPIEAMRRIASEVAERKSKIADGLVQLQAITTTTKGPTT